MINIRELEQRWIRYKIKSYIPYGIGFSVVFIVILISSFLTDDTPKIKEKKVLDVEVVKVEPKKKVVIQKPKTVKHIKATPHIEKNTTVIKQSTITKTDKTNIIKPSMNFIQDIENQPMQIIDENPQPKKITVEEKVVEKKMNVEVIPQEIVEIKKENFTAPKPQQEEEKRSFIKISRESSHGDIHKLVNRFKKTNNPRLSLFIAKKYYDMGNYHQSYNYALITNQIDFSIESSWIIFSKSLVKLGERNQAISTLKKYIQHTHSNNAQLLLDDILSGKFR